ncbi:MAG: cadmium-translocating P-type ATPase [Acidimicrobiales bacterium]|nr:cadmium-translocating P-type ATPase [Acidimicrobiales bacterium]
MSDACCGAGPNASGGPDVGAEDEGRWRIPAAVLAAGAWLVGIGFEVAGSEAVAVVAFGVAVVAGGATFVPGAVRGLARGRLGVGLLMSIALVGAVALGQCGEAASLAFLFSISEALEEWAVTHSRRGLRAVLSLVPDTARVRRGAVTVEIASAELRIGDRVVLWAGERLPTDGVVVEGRSSLDVSAVTGESMPVDVESGSVVLAGSINGGGVLEIEATAATVDSTLARVVRAVEEAQDRKGRAQRLADRIARPLVPGILLVAAAIAVLGSVLGDPGEWIERALVVVVAASPCAFAIAVPVTVFAAIGAATQAGLVIKGGAALEALGTVRVVALDKTGTLTRNRPTVIEVIPVPGEDRARAVSFAASLEACSDHPLARAIAAASSSFPAATDVQAVAGHGITGTVEGRTVRVGKPGFIDAAALAVDVARLQARGATAVLVEVDGDTVAVIGVRDELRPEAVEVIEALHRRGVRVVMLTGDNTATAVALAAQAGIDDVRAELLPADKTRAVEQLAAHGGVAMVGDGINDAPALATAQVGIAMGAAGSDVAIEAADIAIMGDRLTHLPDVLDHAVRTRRIMIQNLVLSGLIIAVLIPVAAFGWLGLGAVVATHEIAEIAVIGNGLRARRRLHRGGAIAPVTTSEREVVHA